MSYQRMRVAAEVSRNPVMRHKCDKCDCAGRYTVSLLPRDARTASAVLLS